MGTRTQIYYYMKQDSDSLRHLIFILHLSLDFASYASSGFESTISNSNPRTQTMVFVARFVLAFATLACAQSVITYNCDAANDQCKKDVAAGKTAQSVCSSKFTACEGCATQEHSCRTGAANSFQAQAHCTSAAQVCYEMALSPGSTYGYYGCQQAFESCSNAPDANHSLCASQNSTCKSCQEKENQCRNAKDANQSLCSSEAGGCFENAMSFGGAL